jgi:hypothetical protein
MPFMDVSKATLDPLPSTEYTIFDVRARKL